MKCSLFVLQSWSKDHIKNQPIIHGPKSEKPISTSPTGTYVTCLECQSPCNQHLLCWILITIVYISNCDDAEGIVNPLAMHLKWLESLPKDKKWEDSLYPNHRLKDVWPLKVFIHQIQSIMSAAFSRRSFIGNTIALINLNV